ncbi:MAG: GNAT family N-acetyltransferase [Gemmatimonadota bacterium]
MNAVDAQIPTPRLVLRRWRVSDAPMLAQAIAASIPELMRWTPWVLPGAPALTVLEERLGAFSEQFDRGEHFIYGMFDSAHSRVMGQAGLYSRVGPDALEIGYFVATPEAGKGFATEAAAALTRVGFEQCGVARIEIRCDPENAASNRIPERLGYAVRETADRDPFFPGDASRHLTIWEMHARDFTRAQQVGTPSGISAGPTR